VKRARELIYTAERQASRDVGLAGLRLKPGLSQVPACLAYRQKTLDKLYTKILLILKLDLLFFFYINIKSN
jgi:hypothetical protein